MTQNITQQTPNQQVTPPIAAPSGTDPNVQPVIAPSAPQITDDRNAVLDILLGQHQLTKEQYDDIKVKSATSGKSIETVLNEMHLFDEEKISRAKAEAIGVPYVTLSTTAFSPEALSFIPRA